MSDETKVISLSFNSIASLFKQYLDENEFEYGQQFEFDFTTFHISPKQESDKLLFHIIFDLVTANENLPSDLQYCVDDLNRISIK